MAGCRLAWGAGRGCDTMWTFSGRMARGGRAKAGGMGLRARLSTLLPHPRPLSLSLCPLSHLAALSGSPSNRPLVERGSSTGSRLRAANLLLPLPSGTPPPWLLSFSTARQPPRPPPLLPSSPSPSPSLPPLPSFLSLPAPCRRAFRRIASSAGYSDWGPRREMGDNVPLAANTVAAAAPVTSWDLTKPLPKLPVPELQSTMDKYLALLTTVVDQQELDITRRNVAEFLKPGCWGEKLQNHLLKRSYETDNWVYDWWLEDMYLKIRLPLPVCSNPGTLLPRQRFGDRQEQLSYACKFVLGLLDIKSIADSGHLPVERCRAMEKGQPLCMEQHYRLLTSYRRPGGAMDSLLTRLGKDRPPHIVVAYRNQFFKVDLQQDGSPISKYELYTQLSRVMTSVDSGSARAPSVGVLTGINRTKWSEARARLMKDPANCANIGVIETSLLVLCLDKPSSLTSISPDAYDGDEIEDLANHILHGQGTDRNSANRWFDKSMQVIVAEDGTCGVNVEHSVAEGIALIQFTEHAHKYAANDDTNLANGQQEGPCLLPHPVRLNWKVTPHTKLDIDEASEEMNKLVDDLDLRILRFDEYGRNFPKSQGFSPDAFIQLALQMTYYKVHGQLTMTYESASTRRFRKGRVDNIRANSPPALAWIKAMLGEVEATIEEKFSLFQAAATWQQKYQTETVLGFGIDCHLLGLREAARELGVLDVLPLFTDPSFAKAHHFSLSTSQVLTSSPDMFTFYGPVVPDGYGAAYNPQPDTIVVCVSSFRDSPDTDSRMFAFSLESTFLQMRELCLQGRQSLATAGKTC